MSEKLWQLSATELASRYRGGLRPSTALDSILDHIAASNGAINAFAYIDEQGARSAATASDVRFDAGEPLGPFDGIAVSIKDNITVKDLPCVWASELFKDYVPTADETPVARLRAQGAVILGKTNVSEFTMGRGNINTKLFGVTRNPWDPSLTPGSSTGGGAAAVAAGFGPVALGTDGGGSVRRPSSHCGLVGLKPTTGRVPRRDGLPIILHDAEIIGPLARTVDDLALTLSAIQAPLDEDRRSWGFVAADSEPAEPRSLRILYIPRFGNWHVEEPVAQSCAAAARKLSELGHKVEQGDAPFDLSLFENYWPTIMNSGLAWLLRDKDWRGHIGAYYEDMMEKGLALTGADYVDALTAIRELYAQVARVFRRYDIVMTPTAGALPWRAEEPGPLYHRAFTGFVSVVGNPAINVPCDPSPSGLPIGVQWIGPYGADWKLIALARQFEKAFPWRQRWPEMLG